MLSGFPKMLGDLGTPEIIWGSTLFVEAGDLARGIVKCIMDPRSRNQDTFLHGHGAFENQYKMEDFFKKIPFKSG